MSTHTGEKPYRCSLCDMSFTEKETLDIHQKTHPESKLINAVIVKSLSLKK